MKTWHVVLIVVFAPVLMLGGCVSVVFAAHNIDHIDEAGIFTYDNVVGFPILCYVIVMVVKDAVERIRTVHGTMIR
jgi:hypothetical protein